MPPKSSTIDYGKPPDALLHQESKVNSLLSPEAPPTAVGTLLDSAASNQKVATPVAAPEPSIPVAMGRQVNLNPERVELEYIPDKPDVPAFRLGFTVGEVCVRDNYVSMLIISDIGFNPTTTMKFDLKYRGKVIPVIFAGAEFEFQTVGIRGISFLVDRNRKDKPAGSATK